MKVTDYDLTKIETERKIIFVQSTFPEIVYGIDKFNRTMWVLNRRTGEQIEVSADNVYAFAFEMMDVADIYLQQNRLFKVVS